RIDEATRQERASSEQVKERRHQQRMTDSRIQAGPGGLNTSTARRTRSSPDMSSGVDLEAPRTRRISDHDANTVMTATHAAITAPAMQPSQWEPSSSW